MGLFSRLAMEQFIEKSRGVLQNMLVSYDSTLVLSLGRADELLLMAKQFKKVEPRKRMIL